MTGAFSELKCYVVSKLMWNKDEDIERLKNSFIDHYYSPAGAVYIREYFELLQKNVAISKTPVSHYGKLDEPLKTYLSVDKLKNYKEIFQKAFINIDTSGKVGKRILKEYLSVLYAELESNKYLLTENKKLQTFNKEQYLADLNFWYRNIKMLNNKYVSLTGFTVDDYYKSYLQFVNGR